MDLRDQLQSTLGDAYTLERELGGGGMSRVFLAEEKALGRKVVIKVLPSETAAQVSIERFKREILLAAKLQHPHIVPLLAAGESGGLPFFTMPFVEGESLRARLSQHGELPVSDAVRILREIAAALAYAHEHGVVHRDIKPDNVLLSGGSAMVSDFGVAKALSASSNDEGSRATSLGIALGTPAYMSPEQATADPAIDHRADIYAFGVLAYELLTGQPPFVGRTLQNLLAAQVSEMPELVSRRRPALPPALSALVMRCLEKRPADRPQRAAEIVRALDDITTPSGGMRPTSAPHATGMSPKSAARRIWLTGSAVAVTVIAIAAVWLTRRGPAAGAATPAGETATRTIAVLPFGNGGDTANAYFSDGMTEELTVSLARIPGLVVRAHSSAMTLRGKSIREAGAKLNVDALIEGSARQSGGRVRVNASLVQVSDEAVLWSGTFQRESKDLFAVEDSIANAIAAALRITLTSTAHARLSVPSTQSPEAHDAYLRAKYQVARGGERDLRQALVLYQRVLTLDSAFAPAWAGIADVWSDLADDWVAPRDGYARAEDAVHRALALDSTLAEANAALAEVHLWYSWDFAAVEREALRAITRNPSLADAYTMYALAMSFSGRTDSAVALMQRARSLDPLSPGVAAELARVLLYGDRYDAAIAASRVANSLDADFSKAHFFAGQALLAKGQPREALAEFESARGLRDRSMGGIANAQAQLGRMDEARRILKDMLAESKQRYVRAEFVAWVYLALGDHENALVWLEKAYVARSGGVPYLKVDPRWLPLRSDVRFQSLVKRAGL